jgi:ribosomal protein S18 acetylase RimI-like enzyme
MNEPRVTISIAEANDYFRCLPLFTLLYHGDIGPDFKRIFEDYVTREEGIILLAELSHRLVGILVGSYHLDIDWEGRTARIDAIIVEETNRKMGIGKKLTQHFIGIAKKRKCRAVKSRVNVNNIIAQKSHERLGFTKANTYEYVMDFQEHNVSWFSDEET